MKEMNRSELCAAGSVTSIGMIPSQRFRNNGLSYSAHFFNYQADNLTSPSGDPEMVNLKMFKISEIGKPMVDVIFAIILLIATLSTAFCVYEATRWNGIQAVDFGDSSMYRSESIRDTTFANTEVMVDVQLFTSWVDAVSKRETEHAEFIEQRFRKEFRPAFDAWIAESRRDPTHPIPAGTPFERPEYRPYYYTASQLLEENASAAFNRGKAANTHGDSYISNTVLFAIVLFFCGVYSRWESVRIRYALLFMTLLIFSYAMYSLGSLLLRVGYV